MIPFLAAAFTVAASIAPPVHVFGGVQDAGRVTAFFRAEDRLALNPSWDLVMAIVPAEVAWGEQPFGPIYGVGLDPVGVLFHRGAFYARSSGGLRLFLEQVPIPEARRFNFAFDAEAGVTFGRVALGLGFHHVSNGGMGERNPGVNYLLLALRVLK